MGEKKRRLRTHAEILAGNPGCIYCAGEYSATTIEHMPPISVFEGRDRPKGLEFPACEGCNGGTKHSDLVAAMLARCWPILDSEVHRRDIKKIFQAVANNIPELLREMDIGRGAEKLARKRHNIPLDAHPLRADGPILTRHLTTFAAKLGFALYYEIKGSSVPASGGVQPMWFSNVQVLNGQIPEILFNMLPSPSTLRQGARNVGSQFLYSYAVAERDHILYLASFSQSFAVAGIAAADRAINLESHQDKFPIVVPGQFRRT